MKALEVSQYNQATGEFRHIRTLRKVIDWEVKNETLYVLKSLEGEKYNSVYILSKGDSVEEIDVE